MGWTKEDGVTGNWSSAVAPTSVEWIEEGEAVGKWKEELGVEKVEFRYLESNLYPVKFYDELSTVFEVVLKDSGGYLDEFYTDFSVALADFVLKTTETKLNLEDNISTDFSANILDFVLRTQRLDLSVNDTVSTNFLANLTDFSLDQVLLSETEAEPISTNFVVSLINFSLG